ncbi:hypothetical protein BGZ63DRAFT_425317 [Mariannaea sp. PMI_226]|nr:hypothetical protein BGZ63DRAFT_425317 [Mariannaea sp. PMI_226]
MSFSSTHNDGTKKLLKQIDWPDWLRYIKREANIRRVWDLIDPNSQKSLTDPGEVEEVDFPEPTITVKVKIPRLPESDGETPETWENQVIENPVWAARLKEAMYKLEIYKIKLERFNWKDQQVQQIRSIIMTTVSPHYFMYIRNAETPREALKILRDMIKPAN